MKEFEYTVIIEGKPVADCYELEHAMLIATAMFELEQYCDELNLTVAIHRLAKS